MKCIVSSAGSAGDFLPALAAGAALRRRGHDVTLVSNPFYESRVRNAGVAFDAAGEFTDVYGILESNPAYAEARNASLLLRDFLTPHNAATYQRFRERFRTERPDVVIASNISFSALWAAAEWKIPSVVVHATPLAWMGWNSPALLSDHALPDFLARPMTATAQSLVDWYISRHLRKLARDIGCRLPDVSYGGSWKLADRELGLWSPTLRGPIAGDPTNGIICGSARGSAFGGARQGVPTEVEAFLAAGPPPMVIGLGSVFSLVNGRLISDFAAACEAIGERCLIVGCPKDVIVPANSLTVQYAPYDAVFSRAAAVAVHCGAGTTGEALRSGKPVIALPFAFDQFSLADSLERLGVGVRVPLAKRDRDQLAGVLKRVVADEAMRKCAAEVGPVFSAERDGAEVAADAVEALVESKVATTAA